MKERASFTFDKETIDIIEKLISQKGYRNKSHVVEYAIQYLGERELNKDLIYKKEANNSKKRSGKNENK